MEEAIRRWGEVGPGGAWGSWGGVAGWLAWSFAILPYKANVTDLELQVAFTWAAWLGTCCQQGRKEHSRLPGET